jgi:hypothetical protein
MWKIKAISSCDFDMSESETGVLGSNRSDVRARYMGREISIRKTRHKSKLEGVEAHERP